MPSYGGIPYCSLHTQPFHIKKYAFLVALLLTELACKGFLVAALAVKGFAFLVKRLASLIK